MCVCFNVFVIIWTCIKLLFVSLYSVYLCLNGTELIKETTNTNGFIVIPHTSHYWINDINRVGQVCRPRDLLVLICPSLHLYKHPRFGASRKWNRMEQYISVTNSRNMLRKVSKLYRRRFCLFKCIVPQWFYVQGVEYCYINIVLFPSMRQL